MFPLTIVDNGLEIVGGELRYAWFRLQTPDGGERVRAVALKELRYIPVEERDDPEILAKQWRAVRGLYNAGVDALYLAAGMFTPRRWGIVQSYGAAAEAETVEAAAAEALQRMAAVEAVLANFPQTRLGAPDLERTEWLVNFLAEAPHILAIVGHPDPRQAARGLGRDGQLGLGDEDLAEQQNEQVFRGLARLQEDFVFQVVTRAIPRQTLTNTLIRVAQIASEYASRQRGQLSIGVSMGIPLMAMIANAHAGMQGGAESQAHSVQDGAAHGWGQGHVESQAHTDSRSASVGGSESWGESRAHTDSVADTVSHVTAKGHADSVAHTEANGEALGRSSGGAITHSDSVSQVDNWSNSEQASQGQAHADSHNWNAGVNVGANESLSVEPMGLGVKGGLTQGLSAGEGGGASDAVNQAQSHGSTLGGGMVESHGQSTVASWSNSVVDSHSAADTKGHSDSQSEAWGTAHTVGHADSVGQQHSLSKSWAYSQGSADTKGSADSQNEAWGQSHAEGDTHGQAVSRGEVEGVAAAFSTGVVPGISINRGYTTEDDVAIQVTGLLRSLESMLNQCSAEGGFMTDARVLTRTDLGAKAAQALIPQAFHGLEAPTPVRTISIEGNAVDQVRAHAFAFLPHPAEGGGDPLTGGGLWSGLSFLNTAHMVAAYTAPGLFEEGLAMTVQEALPPLGFYPDMDGDATLGHQYSPETGDLTNVPVRLSPRRYFHTAYFGDTGFGKSVGAIRQAYESTLKWKWRTIVLDFGTGWRQLLNAPGLEGHVEIYQLWPGAVRAFRWNPLQIGRNLDPETQWRSFADIFTSIARLGVKRQKQELLEALRKVYVNAGVLVNDPEVSNDSEWGVVRATETALAGAPAGTPLKNLPRPARQRLAVERSTAVGLADLYAEIELKLRGVPARDTMLTGVLEGILARMNPLVQGEAAEQYAPGPGSLPIEDLAKPWGIAILEGGAFLDEFSKAFLLGWSAWHLYTDAYVRRVQLAAPQTEILQLVFEEANKIFSGVGGDSGGSEEGSTGQSTADQFSNFFRDSRKAGCWLHIIAQSPALLPPGIRSSCNSLVISTLKDPKDRDLVTAALGKSEKGLVDERWRRFLATLAIGQSVGRFTYTDERAEMEPFLFRPLLLPVPEPTDAEIAERFGQGIIHA